MCESLIFNTKKRYEEQKNLGNFLEIQQLFGNFLKKIATFWQLLDTFIGNFFGIHRQLVAKPTKGRELMISGMRRGSLLREAKGLNSGCAGSCSFSVKPS